MCRRGCMHRAACVRLLRRRVRVKLARLAWRRRAPTSLACSLSLSLSFPLHPSHATPATPPHSCRSLPARAPLALCAPFPSPRAQATSRHTQARDGCKRGAHRQRLSGWGVCVEDERGVVVYVARRRQRR